MDSDISNKFSTTDNCNLGEDDWDQRSCAQTGTELSLPLVKTVNLQIRSSGCSQVTNLLLEIASTRATIVCTCKSVVGTIYVPDRRRKASLLAHSPSRKGTARAGTRSHILPYALLAEPHMVLSCADKLYVLSLIALLLWNAHIFVCDFNNFATC